jgi:hypothetical protein
MVYLNSEELEKLRAEARDQGISLAELMRRVVRRHLAESQSSPPTPPAAFLRIVGLGSSGHSDISEKHDEYLAEAIRHEHAR